MKPADDCRNRILSGQPARVPDGVDDARVTAAAQHHQPAVAETTTSA